MKLCYIEIVVLLIVGLFVIFSLQVVDVSFQCQLGLVECLGQLIGQYIDDVVLIIKVKVVLFFDDLFFVFEVKVNMQYGIVMLSGEVDKFEIIQCVIKFVLVVLGVKVINIYFMVKIVSIMVGCDVMRF